MRGILFSVILSVIAFFTVAAIYQAGSTMIRDTAKQLHTSIPDDIRTELANKLEGK